MKICNISINLLIVLSCLILGCTDEKQNEMWAGREKPNILWITCEDMSPRLGAYGDKLAHTPNIDQLAREGVRYTNVFSVSGVCAPSRAALITGLYPTSFAALHMRTLKRTSAIKKIKDPELLAIPVYEAVPPAEVKCFPELLRANGYYCTNNSKNDYQFRAPVTVWNENSKTAHYKHRSDKSQPFFAIFNITDTHESRVWAHADCTSFTNPEDVTVPPYYPDTPLIRKDIARHYDNIRIMDRKVGKILAELEKEGELEKTVVFFYSDHGDGLPRAKRWIYDSGLHVPLIIRYPDAFRAGETEERLLSFIDFAPSALSLTHTDIPDYIHGRAFVGSASNDEERPFIFAARDRMDPVMDYMRCVRDKRYKLIVNYWPEKPYVQFLPYRDQMDLMKELLRLDANDQLEGIPAQWFSKTRPEVEFYDTWTDPHEVNNLANDPAYANKMTEMRLALNTWEKEYGDMGGIPEPELIRQIWPPEGIQPKTAACEYSIRDENEIEIACQTQGASIAYRFISEDNVPNWSVYTRPIKKQDKMLEVLAHRIGYLPSDKLEISTN